MLEKSDSYKSRSYSLLSSKLFALSESIWDCDVSPAVTESQLDFRPRPNVRYPRNDEWTINQTAFMLLFYVCLILLNFELITEASHWTYFLPIYYYYQFFMNQNDGVSIHTYDTCSEQNTTPNDTDREPYVFTALRRICCEILSLANQSASYRIARHFRISFNPCYKKSNYQAFWLYYQALAYGIYHVKWRWSR